MKVVQEEEVKLWWKESVKQLIGLIPQCGTSSSISDSPIPSPITSPSSDSPLCSSITPSLFHSRHKTYIFHKSYPVVSLLPPRLLSQTIVWTVYSELLGFVFISFLIFFISVPCTRLSRHLTSFWAHVNLPYRIVSVSWLSVLPVRCPVTTWYTLA